MRKIPSILSLDDYKYDLPEEKIAKAPLKNRSDSKLMVYKKGLLEHSVFYQIHMHIPENALLVFNNTRVIPARLHFVKDTGALIEIFLLEPVAPSVEMASAMLAKNQCSWKCMVGNQKRWKEGQLLKLNLEEDNIVLTAELTNRGEQIVTFYWGTDEEFVHVIEAAGKIPLPPYINREVTYEDQERYQTVYSQFNGAVAAPTAGLHFDAEVFNNLKAHNVKVDYLTLHVSAGTFQPIKEDNVMNHKMHGEQIIVTLNNIDNLIKSDFTIAVGTTSMRTMESLYWYGVKLLKGDTDFMITKLLPYQFDEENLPSKVESLNAIRNYLINNNLKQITGHTEIFIFPGYKFRICKGLVSNYHLPGSTLILLVAAFIGEDWRTIYNKALDNNYRFLSYGDSSLLIP
jgi:S-adenosylmethionine:tRNA ribosyltransferase-isomerase